MAGVRWEQADRAAALAEGTGTPGGLRDAAIVAVASDALLRVSEVAALDVADVNLEEQTVHIRRSKTDQEGQGVVQYLGEPTVGRIRAWAGARGYRGGGALPPRVQGGAASARAPDGQEHPGHHRPVGEGSGRRGARERPQPSGRGARRALANAGASLVEMQLAGRWRSPAMPGRYAQGQIAKQGAVAKLRYGL